MKKKCSKCSQVKPLTDFDIDRAKKSGHSSSCKVCRKQAYDKDGLGKKRANDWYWRNRERRAETARQYRLDNPEAFKAKGKENYQKHKERFNKHSKELRRKYTLAAFNAYGGAICACCGETNIGFLTIDHINGVTEAERRIQKTGWVFHLWLKQQGYPPGYQVLCFNCNLGRARNNGICPHKQLF